VRDNIVDAAAGPVSSRVGRLKAGGELNPAKAPKFEATHQSFSRMPDSAPQSTSALVMEKIGVDIFDGRYLVVGQRAELIFRARLEKCPPFCRRNPIIRSNLCSGISRKFWIRPLAKS
jgi:hypothetical protein